MLLWQGNSTYDTEADKRRLRNIRHDNNIEQIRKNGFRDIDLKSLPPATSSERMAI